MDLSSVVELIKTTITTNDIFSGAVLGGTVLGLLNYLRMGLSRLATFVKDRIVVSVTVHSLDSMYIPLGEWLVNNRFDKFSRRYRYKYDYRKEDIASSPAYGTFFFLHKWVPIVVNTWKEENVSATTSDHNTQTRDFIRISCVGPRVVVDRIFKEVLANTKDLEGIGPGIYEKHEDFGDWWRTARLNKNSAVPPILRELQLSNLKSDIETFFQSREWYSDRGVPFRRGYLLYGPPGTGKTSVARYLGTSLNRSIYALSPKNYTASVASAIRAVPPGSILLMEDVDCCVSSSREVDVSKPNLGNILNALDGICSLDEVVVIMTTNHPETLDKALVRPGRIDKQIELGYVDEYQTEHLVRRFKGSLKEEALSKWKAYTQHSPTTPAQLQELLLTKDEPEEDAKELSTQALSGVQQTKDLPPKKKGGQGRKVHRTAAAQAIRKVTTKPNPRRIRQLGGNPK